MKYEDNGATRSQEYNQALEQMKQGAIYKAFGEFYRWYNDELQWSTDGETWEFDPVHEGTLKEGVWILQKEVE